jgi:hypothetical protein
LPSAERIAVALGQSEGGGWVADVTVRDRTTTTHRVSISAAERERYGGGEVADLVRRSFDFMLAREPNTSILREFELSAIERYFPEYPQEIRRG